jgi:predicted PurR-regulated permease PerM
VTANSDRAFNDRAIRFGITGAVVFATLAFTLWVLKSALTPLAVAWVIAYLLDPIIDRFEERRIPRSVAILIFLVLVGGALTGTLLLIVPAIQRDVAGLTERLPGYLDAGIASLLPLLERVGISLPHSLQEGVDAYRSGDLILPLEEARSVLNRALAALRGAVTGTLGALVSLMLIPVLAYYLLVEFDRIRHAVLGLVPPAYRDFISEQAARVDQLISGFIRGQLTVCLALGALYAGGFALIGIDLALVIGAVSGLLAIIPYVGGIVAFVSAAGMCILQYGVDAHLGLVVGWYALVQGLEGFVLTPRIVGQSLGMHPVVVIVALLIGGDLLGFLGLMIAVPAAALVQVFLMDIVEIYRASSLYTGDEAPGDGPPALDP